MPVFKTILETKKQRIKYNGNKCGLIPTMGSLHKGHLSLIKKSLKRDDDICTVSFVDESLVAHTHELLKREREEASSHRLDSIDVSPPHRFSKFS